MNININISRFLSKKNNKELNALREDNKKLQEINQKLQYENQQLKIIELLYNNLRKHFSTVVNTILGKDYYNMGMDVYTTDELTCKDIISEFKKRRKK